MRAILCEKPGPVSRLRVSEVATPAVADDGVLIRVHASSANPVDLFPTSLAGYLAGGRKPVVLGNDFAGVVEAVGRNVNRFRAGDEVFGGRLGAFAEYLVIQETAPVALKPANVSFELAGTAAVAGTTALQALRTHGRLEAGQRVLINGASGGVGTFAVQIARALGGEVTAVCSGRNTEMVCALGASEVIDYAKEDFTRRRDAWDVIVDIAGSHSLRACSRALKRGGAWVGVGAAAVQHARGGSFRAIGHFAGARLGAIGTGLRVRALFIAALNVEDMELLAGLLEGGQLVPAIDRRYDLDCVPEALAYIDRGHARAKVAIEIVPGSGAVVRDEHGLSERRS